MPDIVTHSFFAADLIDRIEDKKTQDILNNHKKLFYLGAQGPDPFYYYQLFKLRKDPHFVELANEMHDTYVDSFLLESFTYLNQHPSDELLTYLLGFLCHHALDSTTHPYVYHVTGIHDETDRGNHIRLEKAIDSILIKDRWNRNPNKVKMYKEFFPKQLNAAIFSPFFDYVLKKVYQKDHGGKVFLNAFKNFRRLFIVLYDPFGIKKTLARFVDHHFNKTGHIVFESLFYYDNINPKIDYMNLNHQKWIHPIDQTEISTQSFLDLYQKALDFVTNEVNAILKGETLEKQIQNTSYSTGKDWHIQKEMEIFHVIFR